MSAQFWDLGPLGPDGKQSVLEGADGPDFMPSPWDSLIVNGTAIPGLIEVHPSVRHKLDPNKKPGSDGATIIDSGIAPGTIDITVTLWTASQWGLFQAVLDEIWRFPNKDLKDGRTPKLGSKIKEQAAVSIDHPALQVLQISAVVFESIEGPIRGAQAGTFVFRIKALQYVPPNKKSQQRKASGTKAEFSPTFEVTADNAAKKKPSQTKAATGP